MRDKIISTSIILIIILAFALMIWAIITFLPGSEGYKTNEMSITTDLENGGKIIDYYNSEWLEITIPKDCNPEVFYDDDGNFHVRYQNKNEVIHNEK